MAFKAEKCRAIGKLTRKRCKQPAMKGSRYCRFHIKEQVLEEKPGESGPSESGVDERKRGAQPGNDNARKHGGYCLQLLPEEESIYQEKKERFSSQLGQLDVFDDQVVHILSLISAKLDMAAVQGAPAQALIPISNEILKLLRSLKETRDSRDAQTRGAPKSFADFLEELSLLEKERDIPKSMEDERRRIYELEREVNELRGRLGIQPREDIEHKNDHCGHCRQEGEHRKNMAGDWVCLNCGQVEKAASKTPAEAATPVDSINPAREEQEND